MVIKLILLLFLSENLLATTDICSHILYYSKINNIDSTIIDGLIQIESSFIPTIVSRDGSSIGLMQLQRPTALDMGLLASDSLLNPSVNIRLGTKYLRLLLDRYNQDLRLALLSYNKGMVIADNSIGKEWKSKYVTDVLMASFSPRCL